MLTADTIRLRHMLDAAQEALRGTEGRSRAALDENRVWPLGVVKCVEIIGEAAARVSDAMQHKYPQIPWAQIVGMRNRLVHAYFEIDLDQVWQAVTEDLPPLVAALEAILKKEEGL